MEFIAFFYASRRRKSRANQQTTTKESGAVDWYFARCYVGISDVCPPLCTKADIDNGVYSLADVEEMNQTMEEALNEAIQARELAMQQAK
ncbi:hypothetical protein MYOV022v2_p0046 [Vibrio phage 12E28.1]|nr:hypothetical protein MYOV022v2_p0046 [Vibrio phage 12E28.1]QZI90215.1 hypothetical protein MYOV021v2_p0046 [Vibrio phage 18E29.1]QZI90580.1 hypothetical protein MYOV023v1_p0033 [Vibrio phage 91E28.1a]QZI90670.1 hypothetical protein MYOV020v1_p0044 [Vibrio phage 98E28.6a]